MKNIMPVLRKICIKSKDEFYLDIDDAIERKKKRFIITANPETVMTARRTDAMYRLLLSRETEIIPDGIGLVRSLRRLHNDLKIQRNTGIELVIHLLEIADLKKKSIFIYGARERALADFLAMCKDRYPHIVIAGCYDGYSNKENEILNILKTDSADIYFTALGTPRQELFLQSFFPSKQTGIFVGIGGSIDVLSGNSRRAPQFFLRHDLEWLYRIAKEPARIKRFLRNNVLYVLVFWADYLQCKFCAR